MNIYFVFLEQFAIIIMCNYLQTNFGHFFNLTINLEWGGRGGGVE